MRGTVGCSGILASCAKIKTQISDKATISLRHKETCPRRRSCFDGNSSMAMKKGYVCVVKSPAEHRIKTNVKLYSEYSN